MGAKLSLSNFYHYRYEALEFRLISEMSCAKQYCQLEYSFEHGAVAYRHPLTPDGFIVRSLSQAYCEEKSHFLGRKFPIFCFACHNVTLMYCMLGASLYLYDYTKKNILKKKCFDFLLANGSYFIKGIKSRDQYCIFQVGNINNLEENLYFFYDSTADKMANLDAKNLKKYVLLFQDFKGTIQENLIYKYNNNCLKITDTNKKSFITINCRFNIVPMDIDIREIKAQKIWYDTHTKSFKLVAKYPPQNKLLFFRSKPFLPVTSPFMSPVNYQQFSDVIIYTA